MIIRRHQPLALIRTFHRTAGPEPESGPEDRVSVSDSPTSPPTHRLVWQSLENAGLLASGVAGGPLGSVIDDSQRQGLLSVLKNLEAEGAQLYTGRGKKLTERDADYVMTRVLEKNPAQLRSSLWIRNSPEEAPDKIESLADLRLAQTIYADGLPEDGLSKVIRNLDRAGFEFSRRPANGHDSKEIGPLEVYHYLTDGARDYPVFVRGGEPRGYHRVSSASTLGAIDFFLGSGDPDSVDDERAGALKELFEMGFEVGNEYRYDDRVHAYQSLLSGRTLSLRSHGVYLGALSDTSLESLRNAPRDLKEELSKVKTALRPFLESKEEFSSSRLSQFYHAVSEPVPGMTEVEQSRLLLQLHQATPEEFPEGIEVYGDPLALELYRQLKQLAPDGERLNQLTGAALESLATVSSSQRLQNLVKVNDARSDLCAVKATLMAEAPLTAESAETRTQSILELQKRGKDLPGSLDQYLSLCQLAGPGGKIEPMVELYTQLLDRVPLEGSDFESFGQLLKPLGTTSLEGRLAAAGELLLEPFDLPKARGSLLKGLRQRVESGQSLQAATAELKSRATALGELSYGTGSRRQKNLEAVAELFFESLPVNADFEEAKTAMGLFAAEREKLDEAAETVSRLLARPEEGLTLSRQTELVLEVKEALNRDEDVPLQALFDTVSEKVSEPADRATVRAVIPRLAKLSHWSYRLDGLVGAVAEHVPPNDATAAATFLEELNKKSENRVSTEFMARSLPLVTSRRKPGQSFAQAAQPLLSLLPSLAGKMEVIETLTETVEPGDFEPALAVVSLLDTATVGQMEDRHLNECLKVLLEHRQEGQPLRQEAGPLLRLGRVLAGQPGEVAKTYSFLQNRARENGVELTEELKRFEDLFYKAWDSRAVRETLNLSRGLDDDHLGEEIKFDEDLIWFGSTALEHN